MKISIIILISLIISIRSLATDIESKNITQSLERAFGDFIALQHFEHSAGYGHSVDYGYIVDRKSKVRVFVYDLNKENIGDSDLKAEFDNSVAGVLRNFGSSIEFEVLQNKETLILGEDNFPVHAAIFKYDNASSSLLFTTSNNKFIKLAITTSRDGFDKIKPAVLELLKHVIEKAK